MQRENLPPPERGFDWRRAAIGTAIGGIVALTAHYMDESPWWWLALPAGFCLAFVSFHFSFSFSARRGAAAAMEIRVDDLRGAQVIQLLEEHLRGMYEVTPAESVHALDLERLRQPDITFWSAWEGAELLGCGALKELDARHGEVKSMRTARARLRKGVASGILRVILAEAGRRGYRRLSLETGSVAAFEPARSLYARFGFRPCGPFADYIDDPHSAFMTLELPPPQRPRPI